MVVAAFYMALIVMGSLLGLFLSLHIPWAAFATFFLALFLIGKAIENDII